MIQLVQVPTAVNDAVLAQCLADLPQVEQAAQNLRHPTPRRRVVVHAVLRRLLSKRLGLAPQRVPLHRQTGGKPVVLLAQHGAAAQLPSECDHALHFSLSYTGDTAMLALASRPVGVDIEGEVPDNIAQIARHVCTDAERARLDRADPAHVDQTFVDIWTAKEAVLKFLGVGFGAEPRNLCMPHALQQLASVRVAAVSPQTPSCVVANWHLPSAATVAVSMAAAPQSIIWEHYAH